MTLIHAFYKIIYISFLISIASHIRVAWFCFCLPKTRKMQTVGFWHPRYPFVPAGSLLCDRLPRSVTSCLLGLQEGEWGTSGDVSPFLQGACGKALPDLGVSSISPNGPLLQLLCRKIAEHSKPTPCNLRCLVRGEAKGKIKTHPMSFCTWSHVLCRCLQERWQRKMQDHLAASSVVMTCSSLKMLFTLLLVLAHWSPSQFSSW